MIEACNRILQAFGANQILLTEIDGSYVFFKLGVLGHFVIYGSGTVEEWVNDDYQSTTRSKWLQAIGEGKTRNDAGEVA
jgi:hypothetical protein